MGTARKKQEIEIEGRKVALTNLDKVLFPSGFTKGQVIDFYVRISDYLLPHLKDRPITLKRYPDGVGAPHFYEKDAPRYTPDWIRTFNVPRRSGEAVIRYIVIDDLPTLVWCANTANLELHPFLHKAPHIDRPTAVAFDLDPGEGTDVLTCATVAFWLKEVFDAEGLESFREGLGVEGHAGVRPAEHRRDVRADAAVRARTGAAHGAGASRPGRLGDGQGQAHGQGVHRLEPELGFQDDRRGLLAARQAVGAVRLDAGDLG